MKIVIALDSFKGSLTTNEVNHAVERGIKKIYPNARTIKIPIADGGEGTVVSLIEGLGGQLIEKEVHNPLMKPVKATYGILEDHTAVIEMASASGLPLLSKDERNPLKTTTYGVGELIKDAISKGCREFMIGIGGSATNDAGIGMLNALGYEFFDENHQKLEPVGEALNAIQTIDDSKRLAILNQCHFSILCDVGNPFYGPNGASFVYAKQKGATDEMIKILDEGLKHFSQIVEKKYHKNIAEVRGAGAAGGLGGGFLAFLPSDLLPGIEVIFNKLKIEEKIKGADFLITGEGKMDFQSVMGKAPHGISTLGKKYHIPVIGIGGAVMDEAYQMHEFGMTALFSIMNYPMTLDEAMEKKRAMTLVENNISELFRLIKQLK